MLSVRNLTKSFRDSLAVNDVSFDAKEGEIFGLLGPNGAGKTTTIRLIATVLAPDSGTAEVNGHDVRSAAVDVRRSVGVLTADIGLYDRFTARENLRYFGELNGLGGAALEQRLDELIDTLDMRRFADRRASTFSTGMKQKVAIARSIVHYPPVIIFDEPTAGLDVLASQTVMSFMRQAREQGKLVILSTHDMAHAQALCDRVAIMHRGRIIALGATADVLRSAGKATLEEAFIVLVGSDAAHTAAREAEERAAKKKKR